MSLTSYVEKIVAQREQLRAGWSPRRIQLQPALPPDATTSLDRTDPEVFGPLYLRQKSEMTVSDNDAEIVSKEYVDDFSAGVGQLNQSLRQPYQLNRWYSSSHGTRRAGSTWADGDCRMSALYCEFDSITVDALRIEVTGAIGGSTARLGLYYLDSLTLLPSALIIDAGTVSTAAVAKVTATLATPQVIVGPAWIGLAVSVLGGAVALSCDAVPTSTAMQVPYGWSSAVTSTNTNSKYALLVTGMAGALPGVASFVTSSTSNFGSGLWLRRSV